MADTSAPILFTDSDGLQRIIDDESDESKLARLDANIEKEIRPESDAQLEDKPTSVKKKKPLKEKTEQETVYAPSYDEVSNDKNNLAESRGEGRYFGVTDPDVSQPVCSNCHRRGHKRNNCKVVVCHACGKVDDHYETQCPNSMICSNCGERGHFRSSCQSKRKQNYCTECESKNHSADRCPSIWRSYVVRSRNGSRKTPYPSSNIFCYNCAQKGHYGDECLDVRVSKTPNINGSAFSGENLPKELITQYRNNIRNLESDSNNSYYRYSPHVQGTNNKRKRDDGNRATNYNTAPPPYPRYSNSSIDSGNDRPLPIKSGFIPMRPAGQFSRKQSYNRGNNYGSGSNYSNKNNNNIRNLNSRTDYLDSYKNTGGSRYSSNNNSSSYNSNGNSKRRR